MSVQMVSRAAGRWTRMPEDDLAGEEIEAVAIRGRHRQKPDEELAMMSSPCRRNICLRGPPGREIGSFQGCVGDLDIRRRSPSRHPPGIGAVAELAGMGIQQIRIPVRPSTVSELAGQ